MKTISRRDVLRAAGAAAGLALPASSWARVLGASDAIRVAVIGFNVLKDALTLEGDLKIGYPTLAATRGIRATAMVGALFLLFTALALPIPYLVGVVGVAYLFPVAVATCVFLFSGLSLLRESDVQNIRRRLRISTLCWSVLPIALIANALFSYTW